MKKLFAIILVVAAWSCSNEADPELDKANFTRIFNSEKYNTSYSPIDIKQTTDGGYLVLAGRKLEDSNFSGIYLIKTDNTGAFESEFVVDESFVNPVGELLSLNDNFYFFCMTGVNLQTQLVEVSQLGEVSQVLNVGGTYPTAAALDGNNFLLLGYDNASKETVFSIVSPSGAITQSAAFSIGAGDAVEEPIINHFIRTGRKYPFQVGKTQAGQYFFNGFYNYTFSLVFTNLNEIQGVVQGQQTDGGISYLFNTNGNNYATARFNFGDNYFIPSTALNTSGISSSTDLPGFELLELTADAPVRIMASSINNTEVLLYASNTKGGQIGIYVYESATGEFLGTKYLGFSNPYEVTNLINTDDEGILVCGTTYVAGRFPRITLFKISREELGKIF